MRSVTLWKLQPSSMLGELTGAGVMIGDFPEEVGQELASQQEQESDAQRGGKAFWVKEMALAETRWRPSRIGVRATPWLDGGLGQGVSGKGGHRRLWAQGLKVKGAKGSEGPGEKDWVLTVREMVWPWSCGQRTETARITEQ